MKLLLLADLNSAHIIKWALALAGDGYQVGIFTLNKSDHPWYKDNPNIQVFDSCTLGRDAFRGNGFSKLVYLKACRELNKVIRAFEPDLIHAHYATSYGLLGRLSGFHPFLLSVWGSDVMDFPSRSIFHKALLRKNFKKADLLLGTSNVISEFVHGIIDKPIETVPFGVETSVFCPKPGKVLFDKPGVVVGTVKSLEAVYGIDILIKAFAEVSSRHPEIPMNLLIVGQGSREAEYKKLAAEMGLDRNCLFTGKVDFGKIVDYHNSLDIFVNLSHHESFGVSVVEAEACGKPVLVTDTGGLKEVMVKDKTGLAVPVNDLQASIHALEKLVTEPELRKRMGEAGRQFVMKRYDFGHNLKKMEQIYDVVVEQFRSPKEEPKG